MGALSEDIGAQVRADLEARGAEVPLGRQNAIGRILGRLPGRGLRLQGLLARWAYWSVHHAHMVRLQGALRTAWNQVGSWIDGRSQPRVKLP